MARRALIFLYFQSYTTVLIFYCQQCILLSHASCPVCAAPAQWSEVADHANISHCQEEMQQNNLSHWFKFNLKRLSHYSRNQRATVFICH